MPPQGLCACVPSQYPPAPLPGQVPNHPFIPPPPTATPPRPLSPTWETGLESVFLSTITTMVSCPGSCHTLLIGLPQFSFSPFILLSTQQPECSFNIISKSVAYPVLSGTGPACLQVLPVFPPPLTGFPVPQTGHAPPFPWSPVWEVLPHLQGAEPCHQVLAELPVSTGVGEGSSTCPTSRSQAVTHTLAEHRGCSLGLGKADPRSFEHGMFIRQHSWDQQRWKGGQEGRAGGQSAVMQAQQQLPHGLCSWNSP